MDELFVEQINRESSQPCFDAKIQERIRNFKAHGRILLLDLPERCNEDLVNFCEQFDAFGLNPEETKGFASHYFIRQFMEHLATRGVTVSPQFFSVTEIKGEYRLIPADCGLSLSIDKLTGNSECPDQTVWERFSSLRCVYRIGDKQVLSAYTGTITAWQNIFTRDVRNRIRFRWERGQRPTGQLREDERIAHDKLYRMEEAMASVYPGCRPKILVPMARDHFERQMKMDSPLLYLLPRKCIYVLVYDISSGSLDHLARSINHAHFKSKGDDLWRYISPEQAITSSSRYNCLVEMQDHALQVFQEAKRQLDLYVEGFCDYATPAHEKRDAYKKIMRTLPVSNDQDDGSHSFLIRRVVRPMKRIVRQLDRTLGKSSFEEKKLLLQLPEYVGNHPKTVMDHTIFPFNFPHLWLERIAEHLCLFQGTTRKELIRYMAPLYESSEASPAELDAWNRLRRLEGSLESSNRPEID